MPRIPELCAYANNVGLQCIFPFQGLGDTKISGPICDIAAPASMQAAFAHFRRDSQGHCALLIKSDILFLDDRFTIIKC